MGEVGACNCGCRADLGVDWACVVNISLGDGDGVVVG